MAELAGQASVIIANRVRDPAFTGTTQAQVISLLSYSQQVVNGALSDVVQNAPLVVQPRTLLYKLSSFLPAAIKVLAVVDASGRDLDPLMSMEALQWLDMRWPCSLADAPRGYLQLGDLLIIYPGTSRTQTLTVKFGQYIPTLALPADSTSVPNEDDSAINTLTEALLLLKGRDLAQVKAAMERFVSRMQELQAERR